MKIENLHDLIDIQNDYATLIKENGRLKLRMEKMSQMLDLSSSWLNTTILGRELLKELSELVNAKYAK